jgi:hypothetical protein
MHKKAMGVAVVAAALSAGAVVYGVLLRDRYRVADILAAYQEGASYRDITVEHPLDGTLFPPEMVPPTFCWKDSSSA